MSKKVIVIRIPVVATIIIVVAITALAIMGYVVNNTLFAEWVAYEEDFFSPDGMYRCHLRGSHTNGGGHSETLIRVYRRKNHPDSEGNLGTWDLIGQKLHDNDSNPLRPYTPYWEYDNERRTRKLTVWVHWAAPEVFMEMFFDSEEHIRIKR